MYVLLNETGEITTCIPHGQSVRQFNDFDLYICFPDENRYRNLNPFVEFMVNGKFKLAGIIDYENWGTKFTFRKVDDNESEFGFVEGHTYRVYHILVPADSGVTYVYGQVPFVISVILGNAVRQSRNVINVSKTYGSDGRTTISHSEMDAVMKTLMMATSLYTFDGASTDPTNVSVDDLYVYSWKSIAFIRGFVTLIGPMEDVVQDEGVPDEYADEYVSVAKFEDCVDVVVPSVVFGHSDSGEDVEFKIVGDGDSEDGKGTIHLLINRNTDVQIGDRIAVVGTFMAKRVMGMNYDVDTTEGFVVNTQEIADKAVTEDKLDRFSMSLANYIGKEEPSYLEIAEAVVKALRKGCSFYYVPQPSVGLVGSLNVAGGVNSGVMFHSPILPWPTQASSIVTDNVCKVTGDSDAETFRTYVMGKIHVVGINGSD